MMRLNLGGKETSAVWQWEKVTGPEVKTLEMELKFFNLRDLS